MRLLLITWFCFCSFSCAQDPVDLEFMEIKELRLSYVRTGNVAYVNELLRRLGSEHEEVVLESLHSIRLLGAKHASELGDIVMPRVGPLLANEDPGFQHSVTATVLSYGEYSYPYLEELMNVVRRNETGAAFFAARTIGMIGTPANRAQDVLVSVLRSETQTRVDAINSLARIGPLSEGNLSEIKAIFSGEITDPYFEVGLARTLLVNGIESNEIEEALTRIALQGSEDLRYTVLRMFNESKLVNEPWIRELLANVAADDKSENVRTYAESLIEKE